MYRTAEQDERLNQLHKERNRVCDYGIEHNVDVSLALDGIDAEIELLTTGIGEMKSEPDTAEEAHAAMIGYIHE